MTSYFDKSYNKDGKGGLAITAFDWVQGDDIGHIDMKKLSPLQTVPLGGISCTGTTCAGRDGDGNDYIDLDSEMKKADSFTIATGLVAQLKGATADGAGYTKRFGSFGDRLWLQGWPNKPRLDQTLIGGDAKDAFDQLGWAPMADQEVLKQQCCLGSIKDSTWCGKYTAPKDGELISEECQQYILPYCQYNQITLEDKNSSMLDVTEREFPKERGCWYFNPMETDGRHQPINDGKRKKWIKRDDITDPNECVLPVSKQLSMDNIERSMPDNSFWVPTNYSPPVVVWVDSDTINKSHDEMNLKTSMYDKKNCGCSKNSTEQARIDREEAANSLAQTTGQTYKEISGKMPPLYCVSPYCGNAFSEGKKWADFQLHPDCNITINSVICSQNIDAQAREEAKIAGLKVDQTCIAGGDDGESSGNTTERISIRLPTFAEELANLHEKDVFDTYIAQLEKYSQEDSTEQTGLKFYSPSINHNTHTLDINVSGPSYEVEYVKYFVNKEGFQHEVETALHKNYPEEASKNFRNVIIVIVVILVVLGAVAVGIFTFISKSKKGTINTISTIPTTNQPY